MKPINAPLMLIKKISTQLGRIPNKERLGNRKKSIERNREKKRERERFGRRGLY